jgi:hypothetical protein
MVKPTTYVWSVFVLLGKGGRGMAQRRAGGRTLKGGGGKTLKRVRGMARRRASGMALKRDIGMALKVYTVIMSLVCILAGVGIGWLTTKGNLEAAQLMGDSLRAENAQYASSLAEANRQVILANATIETLEQKLAESEKFGASWWERAHPKEFKSVEELKTWLAQDVTNDTFYIFGNGCLSNYDCDDYAVALVRNALSDGYLVSLQVEERHMINSTIIGNKIYFIDPQSDKVWFWGYRDR